MYTKANMDEITSLIQVYLPEVDSIYLFGSYSKELAREDSDIDITIIMNSVTAEIISFLGIIAVPGTFSTKDHIFWRIGVVSCLGERK